MRVPKHRCPGEAARIEVEAQRDETVWLVSHARFEFHEFG
jgi:hypothetical protein